MVLHALLVNMPNDGDVVPGIDWPLLCTACLVSQLTSTARCFGAVCVVTGVPMADPCPAMQAAFHVFGMELLAELDLDTTNQFFSAFFRLPAPHWQGFLASRLSSARLIVFAAATFMVSASSSSIRDMYGS